MKKRLKDKSCPELCGHSLDDVKILKGRMYRTACHTYQRFKILRVFKKSVEYYAVWDKAVARSSRIMWEFDIAHRRVRLLKEA